MSGSDVPQTRVGGRWRIDTGGREAGFVTDMPLQPPLRGYSARHRLTNSAEHPDNFDEEMMSLLYEASKEGRAEESNARSEEIARISPAGDKGLPHEREAAGGLDGIHHEGAPDRAEAFDGA